MKFPFLFLVCFLSVSLSGCTYQYMAQSADKVARVTELKPRYQVERLRKVAVRATNTVCVAPVKLEDVQFQQALDQGLFAALQTRFIDVRLLTNVESTRTALREAWRQDCDLLFYPAVLSRKDKIWSVADWEEPQTGWSDLGMDRLQLGFSVWDVNAAQVMDKAVVQGRSAWLDLYSSDSVDLIAGAIEQYLQQLVALH